MIVLDELKVQKDQVTAQLEQKINDLSKKRLISLDKEIIEKNDFAKKFEVAKNKIVELAGKYKF